MTTWDKFDEKIESDKDEEEENLRLMATTTFDVEYESNSDD